MTLAGVYIHIPFCRSRCSYCDFATGMYQSALADRYVECLVKEIQLWQEVESFAAVDTIFFGGGTPSLLTPSQINAILQAVGSRFSVMSDTEVTLEINPGDGGTTSTVRLNTLQELRALGVNRASFGAQSFDDEELKHLGRRIPLTTSNELSTSCVRRASQRRFDLIAGLPGQTWKPGPAISNRL